MNPTPALDPIPPAVRLLACMAHPVRLAVLDRLHRKGPADVQTLQAELAVAQSGLSHHLRQLRDTRLVVGEREGRRVVYRLHDHHVGSIVADTLAHAVELDGEGRR